MEKNFLSSFEDNYKELQKLLWGDDGISGIMMDIHYGQFTSEDETNIQKCAELFRSFNDSLTENQKKMLETEGMVYDELIDCANEGRLKSDEDKQRLARVLNDFLQNPIEPTSND